MQPISNISSATAKIGLFVILAGLVLQSISFNFFEFKTGSRRHQHKDSYEKIKIDYFV